MKKQSITAYKLIAGVGIALLFVLLSGNRTAFANAIAVNSTSDIIAVDGTCTLREAVRAANLNIPSGIMAGECAAGSNNSTDTITLQNGRSYTLLINGVGENASATGDLDITNNNAATDIAFTVASGGTATVRIGPDDRIFHVLNGAGATFTGLTIRSGDTSSFGAGLYNQGGTVVLSATTITNNDADLHGGGIYNSGTLTIQDNSVIGGAVPNISLTNGGGIYNTGTLVIDNSTVSSNDAATSGGGIYNTLTGTVTVQNNSVIGGAAGNISDTLGGGVYNAGSMVIDASTIEGNSSDNGGGMYNAATGLLTIQNSSIIGGPTGNVSSYSGGGINNAGTLVIDASSVQGNSANNGGGLFNGGGASLTLQTNSTVGGATGNSSVYKGGGIYNVGTMEINASTVSNNLAQTGGGGLFNGGILTVQNGSLIGDGNITPMNGGGVYNQGQLTFNGSTLQDNTADLAGGAIYNDSGSVTIENASFIDGNSAENGDGGGIYNTGAGASLTVESSTLSNNYAAEVGGAIWNSQGAVLSASLISSNMASASGGGVHHMNGTLTVENGTVISGNFASLNGGGISNQSGSVFMTDSEVSGNSALMNGGGIYNNGGFSIQNSIISFNYAEGYGGGIAMQPTNPIFTLDIVVSQLIGNQAAGYGEALYTDSSTANTIIVSQSCISGNGSPAAGDIAFFNNELGVEQDAEGNWWGAPDGPWPYGSGDGFIGNFSIQVNEWLTEPPPGC